MINEIIEEDCKNVIDYLSPLIPKIKGKSFLVAGATSFLGLNIVNTSFYKDNKSRDISLLYI